jgi:hypothetical protein
MEKDRRDIIWNDVYELYYDTYYNELLALTLSNKWSFIDLMLKIVTALAAVLSTVLGLLLWNDPVGKFAWLTSSSVVVILIITYIVINISGKIKRHMKSNKEFFGLRYAIESLRDDIDNEQDFDIDTNVNQIKIYANTFNDICKHTPLDSLEKNSMFKAVQKEVDNRLSGLTYQGSERIKPGKRIVNGIDRGAPSPKPHPSPRQFKFGSHHS